MSPIPKFLFEYILWPLQVSSFSVQVSFNQSLASSPRWKKISLWWALPQAQALETTWKFRVFQWSFAVWHSSKSSAFMSHLLTGLIPDCEPQDLFTWPNRNINIGAGLCWHKRLAQGWSPDQSSFPVLCQRDSGGCLPPGENTTAVQSSCLNCSMGVSLHQFICSTLKCLSHVKPSKSPEICYLTWRAFQSQLPDYMWLQDWIFPRWGSLRTSIKLLHYSETWLVQFLESYKSVTLQSMADAFGISVDFIDEEVAEFIVDGRLPAKIDRVAGVIETKRWPLLCSLMPP